MLRFLCLMRTPPRVGFSSLVLRAEKGNHAHQTGQQRKKRSGTGGRRRRGDESAPSRSSKRGETGVDSAPRSGRGRASPRVKTRARSLQPICVARSPRTPPSLLRPFESASPGKLRAVPLTLPPPPAPTLLAVGGEGGVAAPRARHPRRHVAYLMHSSFSSLSFSSTTQPSRRSRRVFLCLYAPRPRRRSAFFRFFGFRPGNFAENCFAPKQ